MASAKPWRALSAQQVDPLSWFTGPLVPLAFSTLALIYGGLMTVTTWGQTRLPWLQVIAVVLCAGAGFFLHVTTRPLRRGINARYAAIALAVSVSGMLLSAAGYQGSGFDLERWWGPAALSLTVASLGPYLPARQVVLLGVPATLVATVGSLAIVHTASEHWGPVGTALLIAYAPALGVAATVTFSYSVVTTMVPMLESPSQLMVPGQKVRDEVAQQLEEVTVARLTARAAPFLEGIAAAGRITPADRALAGQLARRMRDELVTQSNLSWLDSIAAQSRLVVVDPERRASRMNAAQRTTLRAMLGAILDTPGTDAGSLMIELRSAADGATAVALSLDMSLPEGTRILHLAPYYLSLGTTVEDLKVDSDNHLRLSFRVPPEDGPGR